MHPPDYHNCVQEVLSSSLACHAVVETLTKMTATEAHSEWRNFRREPEGPPPHGPEVEQQLPADVRVVMLEDALKAHREGTLALWQRLSDIMGIPMMQESLTELITSVGMRIERQQQRITELEARVAELEA